MKPLLELLKCAYVYKVKPHLRKGSVEIGVESWERVYHKET